VLILWTAQLFFVWRNHAYRWNAESQSAYSMCPAVTANVKKMMFVVVENVFLQIQPVLDARPMRYATN